MRRMTAVLLAFVCLTAAAAVLSGPLATRAGTMSGTGEGRQYRRDGGDGAGERGRAAAG
jgi:hypothetical protein